jgi:hypothetical protein
MSQLSIGERDTPLKEQNMAVKKRPALQGELDGACGFYAIANGIHLLEPELALPEIFPIILQQYVFDGDPMGFVNGIARGSLKNTLSRTMALLNAEYEFYDRKPANNGSSPSACPTGITINLAIAGISSIR